jgi:hypothetical protein
MVALPADAADAYPLSPLQQGKLFHQVQAGWGQAMDIEQLEGSCREPIDTDVFTRAWAVVAAAHPALRTLPT